MRLKKLVFACLLTSLSMTGFAEQPAKHDKAYEKKEGVEFLEKKAEGWFFYKDLPPEVKERLKKEAMKEAQKEEEPVGSVKWFQKNLPELRAKAQDNPTEANVKAYLIMERLMMEKAKRYAMMTQKVVMQNPYLNFRTYNPGTIHGKRAQRAVNNIEKENLVRSLNKRFGIWFFFNGGDPVAEAQAKDINEFTSLTQIKVLKISLNGEGLNTPGFGKFEQDNGISKEFDFVASPTMYIYDSKKEEFTHFSNGALNDSEMLENFVLLAKHNGWITEEEFQKTRFVKPKKPIQALLERDLSKLNEISKDSEGFVNQLELMMGVKENVR